MFIFMVKIQATAWGSSAKVIIMRSTFILLDQGQCKYVHHPRNRNMSIEKIVSILNHVVSDSHGHMKQIMFLKPKMQWNKKWMKNSPCRLKATLKPNISHTHSVIVKRCSLLKLDAVMPFVMQVWGWCRARRCLTSCVGWRRRYESIRRNW